LRRPTPQNRRATGFDVDTFHSIANSIQPGLFTKATQGSAKWTDPGIVDLFRGQGVSRWWRADRG
jgi:raffinose/stachyose/melibiose transport system substrate-binding protein